MINTIRHQEVFDSHLYQHLKLVVVGAGAIGSRVAENLISTGLENITFIDFDKVEDHNLGNQLYVQEDIGEYKVVALKRWAESKIGLIPPSMCFVNGRIDEKNTSSLVSTNIIISCVDKFSARKLLMTATQDVWADLFVDTRMASGHGDVYLINPDQPEEVDYWNSTCGSDDDPAYEVSSCGSSLSVGVTAQTIAAVASWSVMNYLKTGFKEKHIRMDTAPWLVSR